MKIITPTQNRRINELTGLVLLAVGLLTLLSLLSYSAQDPSWDTVSSSHPVNLAGYFGSYISDLCFQTFGAIAFLLPLFTFVLAWRWIRSEPIQAPVIKLIGSVLLVLSACVILSFGPGWLLFGAIHLGGTVGLVLADVLQNALNLAGAVIFSVTTLVISVYLVSTFTMSKAVEWTEPPASLLRTVRDRWFDWREERRHRRMEKARLKKAAAKAPKPAPVVPQPVADTVVVEEPPFDMPAPELPAAEYEPEEPEPEPEPEPESIPICPLAETTPGPVLVVREEPPPASRQRAAYRIPETTLLNEVPGRSAYDEQELKDIAVRVKSKFEEFNVLGSVVQINPGPVVTTFEFKPDAGIKYSRITTLTEDLCLGLQAESILIERIPGKPTVGIEVPNSKRELISLRQILESDEFQNSQSHLTIPLGKDINGRIKVAALDSMPHLLIAGSTGSGKSVMINSMIMSILYKSTPDEVRMIMVDPKRLELGLYEGIPHLLTPVITDPRKATNALRNAVLEMERRLRLLAEYGVRNIDQFNRKIRKLQEEPRSLFEERDDSAEDLRPLPYIMILIDELADLMMLEGRNVEESVTRLAQMARAVGMHLVLATQRPSVDVITGLIKANFPARISFRVATRVDSRTILDVMGSEHLLGKGDMLFLPPGSSRLVRVHGAFVTETEINRVVGFWKEQATPEYDQSFLIAPPADDADAGQEEAAGEQDPLYEDALRIVLELGKASTSTLQRRLRLGYGRAARILDTMQRDGIIGPPDGSKPREVLKRPDWLREIEVR
jgi:S-DNA-T family DNA segregation ATPase FtsK/SpoIIIE